MTKKPKQELNKKYGIYHNCTVPDEEAIPPHAPSTHLYLQFKRWLQTMVLIYDKNPRNLMYFRSNAAVRREKKRQYYSKYYYIIHPLSKFRSMYEIYLIFFYFMMILIKTLDGSFVRWIMIEASEKSLVVNHLAASAMLIDGLSILDIIIIFFTGYIVHETKHIELSRGKIATHYIKSIYFYCDVLSSIPKYWVCGFTRTRKTNFCSFYFVYFLLNSFGYLKLVRLLTLYKLINKITDDYLNFRFKGLLSFSVVTFQIMNFMTCLQMAVPRYRKMLSRDDTFANDTWIFVENVLEKPILSQYLFAMFKSTSYNLGIYMECYPINNWEETILAILNYIMGRLLISLVWIVLLSHLLSVASLDTKYIEMMDQLNSYMVHKQLPMDLRDRLIKYYKFKYQKSYFNEKFITGILSDTLNNKINIHKYKFLIESIDLFKHLTNKALGQVVSNLISEVFLPNDTIIQSGTTGDSMYFLASGTVAVYTHSGKEICHLQDGSYFGEISLILRGQKRSATVISIEICEVYRLERKKFEELFLDNPTVFNLIIKQAEARLEQTNKLEEKYTRIIFEQTYKRNR